MEKSKKIKKEILEKVYGNNEAYKEVQKAIIILRHSKEIESPECYDMLDFLEDLIKKTKDTIQIAIDKSFEAGIKQATSGKYCVKLVRQGKQTGQIQAIQDEIKFLEELEKYAGVNEGVSIVRKRIEKLKQKLK